MNFTREQIDSAIEMVRNRVIYKAMDPFVSKTFYWKCAERVCRGCGIAKNDEECNLKELFEKHFEELEL